MYCYDRIDWLFFSLKNFPLICELANYPPTLLSIFFVKLHYLSAIYCCDRSSAEIQTATRLAITISVRHLSPDTSASIPSNGVNTSAWERDLLAVRVTVWILGELWIVYNTINNILYYNNILFNMNYYYECSGEKHSLFSCITIWMKILDNVAEEIMILSL